MRIGRGQLHQQRHLQWQLRLTWSGMLGLILVGKKKKLHPSSGYSKKMSISCLSQKNQSYLAVIVGNEPVGKAVVGLTIVELEDDSEHQEDSLLKSRK